MSVASKYLELCEIYEHYGTATLRFFAFRKCTSKHNLQ